MKTLRGLLMVTAACLLSGSLWAADAGTLEKENAALKDRVAKLEAALTRIESQLGDNTGAANVKKLEQENQVLKDRLGKLETTVASQPVPVAPAAGAAPAGSGAASGATGPTAQLKNFVESKFNTKLYGYVKLDAAYDSSRMQQGNYGLWANSEQTNDDDDEFNITARQSRLGLLFNGPNSESMNTGGRIEVDFYGDGAENKAEVMLRRAYLDLTMPDEQFYVLAGQEWDIFSPVSPQRVNYLPMGFTGDLGYRRPTVRMDKGFTMGPGTLLAQAAVVRTIGITSGFDPGDSGEDAGEPGYQGRLSWSQKLWTDKPMVFGVSGEYGKEEYDTNASGGHEDFNTWGVCFDLTLPITSKIALVGEVYSGSNLNQYLGGIGQGINTTLLREVDADGGYASINYTMNAKWAFNVGWGADLCDRDDLNVGSRESNTALFVNTFYKLNPAVTLGFEVSQYETEYVDLQDGDAMRYQGMMQYSF